jgi:hypothetical protein
MGVGEPGGDFDFPEKPLGAEDHGQLRVEHLDGNRAIVFPVLGQIDRRHASPAHLPFDQVAVGQSLGKIVMAGVEGSHAIRPPE